MTIQELERRLRMPALDEPAVLPALVLPMTEPATLAGREVRLRLGRSERRLPLRLAIGVLLLLGVLIGAIAAGAIYLTTHPAPFLTPGLYAGRGIQLDYPPAWTRLTPIDPFGGSGASVALLASSRSIDGCEPDSATVSANTPPPPQPTNGGVDMGDQTGTIFGLEDRMYACLIEREMAPGEVRLIASQGVPQRIAIGPMGDFEEPFLPGGAFDPTWLPDEAHGFTESIDGMPARLVVRPRSVVPGADEVRTWLVATPGAPSMLWFIQAVIRGPDLETLRKDADDVARSVRFDVKPTPLDADGPGDALGRAIDRMDREWRRHPGTRFLGCLPRVEGSRSATIVDGPAGRLRAPLEVDCATAVEATQVHVWRATVEVTWPARDGVESGRWAREILFDANGESVGETDLVPGTGEPLPFPGNDMELPPPGEGPLDLAPGTLVKVLPPGTGAAIIDVPLPDDFPSDRYLHAEAGRYLVIVEGPERQGGLVLYTVDTGEEAGWVAANAGGRPLLAIADPHCPPTLTDVTDLVYLSVVERRLCYPGELKLGPVQAGPAEVDGSGEEISGDPAWLASTPSQVVYGRGGRDGLDPGLPVALAPAAGKSLPLDGWLTIRGHFDDPAAATCSWSYPESWGRPDESREIQTRRCQERFVVTAVEPADAP
jgi:hypothetical protein